jgi:hypothetical protein
VPEIESRRARVVDFLGNPQMQPRVVMKMAWDLNEVQQKREMLRQQALLISEEAPMGVASHEEVVKIIGHHFNLSRYEFHVFRSRLDPFLLIFSYMRDVVFARGRVLDGLVDLMFHSWEVDRLGERLLIPYHVKISLEGLPNTCGR